MENTNNSQNTSNNDFKPLSKSPEEILAQSAKEKAEKIAAKANPPKSGKKRGRPKKVKNDTPSLVAATIKAMKDAGYSLADIALNLGKTEEEVKMALKNHKSIDPKDLEKVKEHFSGSIATIIQKILVRAGEDDFVKNLKGSQLPIALGTLIDKLNILTGKPTQITETRNIAEDVANKLAELEHLEKLLQKPKDGGTN